MFAACTVFEPWNISSFICYLADWDVSEYAKDDADAFADNWDDEELETDFDKVLKAVIQEASATSA